MFFSNLTTYIAEIEIYLRKKPSLRDQIPKDPKHISEFQKLFDKVRKSPIDDNKKGKSSHNKKPLDMSEKILGLLNWDFATYAREWELNQELMKSKPFKQTNRVAERRGERFLVMCGLSWNFNSQNKARDWLNVVAAVTLETAVVESYRMDLLVACPGACKLREEMREYFVGIASAYHKPRVAGGTHLVTEWAFPDGYDDNVSTRVSKSYDPDVLRKDMVSVPGASVATPKGKRGSARDILNDLAKNSLLRCSDPNAAPGSLETLAYNSISALSRVSHPFTARVCLPQRLTPPHS